MHFPLTTTALCLYFSFFPTATATQCDRTFLNDMSALYTDAQAKGLPSVIPSLNSTSLIYTEQFQPKALNASILTKPLNITSTRRFIDAALCISFTQLIVTSAAHPYVIGTRMEGDGLYITKMETLVTDAGDWAFNATGYAYYDGLEEWGPIPEAERDSRAVIQAAGDKYFDRFADVNVSVPWGEECARLEGGAYTDPRGKGGNTCDLGLPGSIKVVDRRYVVDEEAGVVSIFVGFPGLDRNSTEPTPDSHTFRVEHGKIRYIHTLSTCEGHPGCGMNSTLRALRV